MPLGVVWEHGATAVGLVGTGMIAVSAMLLLGDLSEPPTELVGAWGARPSTGRSLLMGVPVLTTRDQDGRWICTRVGYVSKPIARPPMCHHPLHPVAVQLAQLVVNAAPTTLLDSTAGSNVAYGSRLSLSLGLVRARMPGVFCVCTCARDLGDRPTCRPDAHP